MHVAVLITSTIPGFRWDGRALISSINQNISLKFPLDHSQNNGKDSSDQPQDDQQSPTVGKPPIEEASVQVREVAWSLDGMMLATRTSEVVRIWDAEVSRSQLIVKIHFQRSGKKNRMETFSRRFKEIQPSLAAAVLKVLHGLLL